MDVAQHPPWSILQVDFQWSQQRQPVLQFALEHICAFSAYHWPVNNNTPQRPKADHPPICPSSHTKEVLLEANLRKALYMHLECLFVSVGIMMPRSNAPCWLPMEQSCPPLLELPKYRTTTTRMQILCRQAIAMVTYRLLIPQTQVPSKSSHYLISLFSSLFTQELKTR